MAISVGFRGIAKLKKLNKKRDNYGSGWVGLGLTQDFCVENYPVFCVDFWKLLTLHSITVSFSVIL